MNMNIINEQEKERALIFLKRKTIVHISRENGLFHNGLILEVGGDFFILKDRIDGKEILILFSELKYPLEQFKENGK